MVEKKSWYIKLIDTILDCVTQKKSLIHNVSWDSEMKEGKKVMVLKIVFSDPNEKDVLNIDNT